jgi:hypothetical protein
MKSKEWHRARKKTTDLNEAVNGAGAKRNVIGRRLGTTKRDLPESQFGSIV